MRTLLFIAVIALGADALLYNGSYTQAAWRTASNYASDLMGRAPATDKVPAKQG